MATAFARMAAPDGLTAVRRDAVDRIAGAVAQHPFMVAGSGRLCTEVMQLTGRRVMIKTGADGVYTAAVKEKGVGIALKIDDGSKEAAEVTLLATLNRLGVLHDDDLAALADRCRIPITNTRGIVTGHREPSEFWS
jgi:L-asparaginase II